MQTHVFQNCKCTLKECFQFLGYKLPKQIVSGKAWHENEEVLDETCRYLVRCPNRNEVWLCLWRGRFKENNLIFFKNVCALKMLVTQDSIVGGNKKIGSVLKFNSLSDGNAPLDNKKESSDLTTKKNF